MKTSPPSSPQLATLPPGSTATVLAFDIGGANLKAADGRGWVASAPFELWRRWQELPAALCSIVAARRPQQIVATMTGEIADCYPSRRAGVAHIVGALEAAARAVEPAAPLLIYLVDGSLVSAPEALSRPLEAAASNWHAVARLAAHHAKTPRAVLIDIGSTTTDIIPLMDGAPQPLARDDVGRMATGELVYTGVERTPVAAIVRRLHWQNEKRPVASELYAQSRDIWLLLEGLPENPLSTDTADGGPFTADATRVRLARMLLIDPPDFSHLDAVAAARQVARVQAGQVARALRKVRRACGWRPTSLVLSGHGECLARAALARLSWKLPVVELRHLLGPESSRAAPAHSLALIAQGLVP